MGERDHGSIIEDGGPAFPGDMPTVQLDGNKLPFAPGMSLRDWFAGQFLSAAATANEPLGVSLDAAQEEIDAALKDAWTAVARAAYIAADAMLRARAKATTGESSDVG